MRRIGVFVMGVFLMASVSDAEVPKLIRYQGQAVDSKGVPLEGPYALTFRLYDAETAGTVIWQETQPDVLMSGGNFSVLLGQVQGLQGVDWSRPLWLSVQVNQDAELSPRQRITSVPLAIRAERAEQLTVPVTTSTITDDANRLMPSGAIILWTGSACPAGYTRSSALDGKFLVANASYNPAAGGSTTHNHGGSTGNHALTLSEIPSHTHGIRGHYNGGSEGPNWFPNTSDPVYTTTESAGGGQGHSHTINAADHRPPYATVLLCQKD